MSSMFGVLGPPSPSLARSVGVCHSNRPSSEVKLPFWKFKAASLLPISLRLQMELHRPSSSLCSGLAPTPKACVTPTQPSEGLGRGLGDGVGRRCSQREKAWGGLALPPPSLLDSLRDRLGTDHERWSQRRSWSMSHIGESDSLSSWFSKTSSSVCP